MKLTTTFAQQQFLELLRAGLWGTPADPSHFTKEATDWKQIYRIAKEQTVQVIVADGIETLPKENWPPKEIMLKFMMVKVKTSQMHTLLNTTLSQVVNALNAEGIPSVLLKGQGVAQNYRHPESRMCGDIDLYVGKKNFEKASDVICTLDPTQFKEEIEQDALHRNFTINGTEIELHKHSTSSANQKQRRLINEWSKESLDNHFNDDSLPSVNFGQTSVSIPSADFNAVFLLHHAARHMITEGISLRQICDWTIFLHRHHTEINEAELQETLRKLHMSTIWKEFGILAVTMLHLDATALPAAPKEFKSSKTTLLLENIFKSGNFGRYDNYRRTPNEGSYIKRKWRSLCVQTLRFIKIFPLFPHFTISYSAGWLPSAISRVFQSK